MSTYYIPMYIDAKLAGAAGAAAPVVFFWSRSLVVLNKSQILLNKSRILILHPHFFGPFGAYAYVFLKSQKIWVIFKKCSP